MAHVAPPHLASVPTQHMHALPGPDIPDARVVVKGACDDEVPRGVESQAHYLSSVPTQARLFYACLHIP
jgi:hypothetical protein